jgi:hypothetical protein
MYKFDLSFMLSFSKALAERCMAFFTELFFVRARWIPQGIPVGISKEATDAMAEKSL